MNVFLDDEREPPNGFILVRNIYECIEFLRSGEVEILSLDHDLGDGKKTGYDLVKYMVEHNIYPSKAVYIHTMNPVGRENMYKTLVRYAPKYLHVYNHSFI